MTVNYPLMALNYHRFHVHIYIGYSENVVKVSINMATMMRRISLLRWWAANETMPEFYTQKTYSWYHMRNNEKAKYNIQHHIPVWTHKFVC